MFTPESHTPPSSRQKIAAIEAALDNCRRLVEMLESELLCEVEAAERAANAQCFVARSRAIVAACHQGHADQVAMMLHDQKSGVAEGLKATVEDPMPESSASGPAIEADRANGEIVAPKLSATPVADDLTMIRGIDDATAAALASLGVESFRDIAAFKADDVDTVNLALAEPRRVQRQCWIEQAALLAAGSTTAFSRSRHEAALPRDTALDLSEAELATSFETFMTQLSVIDAIANVGFDAVTMTSAGVTGKIEPDAGAAVVALPPAASNVVALKPRRTEARKRIRTVHWMAAAASITLLAAATIATVGMRPAFAQYLHGLGCSSSLTALVPACGQLTLLQE